MLCVELKVWQKVKIEGDALIGRAAHTLVADDSHIVLYGGSADCQPRIGHCTRYFNDVYIMKTGGLNFNPRVLCSSTLAL